MTEPNNTVDASETVEDVLRDAHQTLESVAAMRRQGKLPPYLDARLKMAECRQQPPVGSTQVSPGCGSKTEPSSPTTPNPNLPPMGDGPRRKMIIEIKVTADFEKRLDNQWMVEREIHAARWKWNWEDEHWQEKFSAMVDITQRLEAVTKHAVELRDQVFALRGKLTEAAAAVDGAIDLLERENNGYTFPDQIKPLVQRALKILQAYEKP